MNIALIGASGFVGTRILNEALQRGHKVTAIVRHPEKVTAQHPALTIKKGDARNEDELAQLLAGHDAVVSAYNAGWDNPNLYDEFLATSKTIEKAVQKAGVKRLLVIGGAGSLEIAPGKQLVDSPEFPAEWKSGALSARDYLNVLKENKALDWTFLSPAIMLQPGERTGKYRIGADNPVMNAEGKSEISAEDMAVAIIDELEQGKHLRKRFTVGY